MTATCSTPCGICERRTAHKPGDGKLDYECSTPCGICERRTARAAPDGSALAPVLNALRHL